MSSTSMMEVKPIWERITTGDNPETDNAWAAFEVYRDMPLVGKRTERRSYGNLAVKIEHRSETTIQGWARKYQWRNRVKAYDAHRGRAMTQMRSIGIEEYRTQVVEELTQQVFTIKDVANKVLMELHRRAEEDLQNLETKELNDIVKGLKGASEVVKQADDLARRAASMPTQYTSAQGDDAEPDVIEYYIGSED